MVNKPISLRGILDVRINAFEGIGALQLKKIYDSAKGLIRRLASILTLFIFLFDGALNCG